MAMKALEKRAEIRAQLAVWRKAFGVGAEPIGTMSGQSVMWHDALGIWGVFGQTGGKGGSLRAWNAFGQKPNAFRSNIVVEINMPSEGVDQNLQALFATDIQGRPWLLHQGRMSVAGSRVTEADFVVATGLKPSKVSFSDGTFGAYHKVVNLGASAAVVQASVASFIAQCARARLVKLAKGAPVGNLANVSTWEHGLSPETAGTFAIAPRGSGIGRRVHGEIWRALAAELKKRNVPHSNDRVSQYGPDLFVYGDGPQVLFEIKSQCGAHDVFGAIGQLQIYDQLLGGSYRKVLVVPEGMGQALREPIGKLDIEMIEFRRKGKKIILNQAALKRCLK
ncbi:hypothetical protein [Rhizobium laguerreae]|uniref:hypothetical protein n=1 Tax=Rhizobium laguerreae TaxID=1076926 RepID=UPI001C9034A8|nr:hypothetical protein [Rhizobium laguerreae]MBY3195167.1 hypothetical protein [Rhizobium laguerreae]